MTETPDDILHMPEYEVRACKTTFRLQLPEMMDGFRLTLRLHEYVEKAVLQYLRKPNHF